MLLSGKPLIQITEEDIEALQINGIPEGRSLDYKRDLPLAGKLQKYQNDVCAFSNSGGGLLVFGIEEDKGVPSGIPGVEIPDLDALIRQLDGTVRDGLDPAVIGVQYRSIPLKNGRHVFIVGIPAGWNPPHMVQASSLFYIRHAADQAPMDVREIRRSILASEGEKSSISRWRSERLAMIQAGQGPRRLGTGTMIVVHIAPIGYGEVDPIDLGILDRKHINLLMPVHGYHRNQSRYTLDGLLVHDGDHVESTAYLTIYKDGRIETAAGRVSNEKDGLLYYSPAGLEKQIIALIDRIRAMYTIVGMSRQWAILVSLLHANGLKIASNWGASQDRRLGCDRPTVLLPEVLMHGEDVHSDVALRPIFDAMWNTCGHSSSMNYGEDGLTCAPPSVRG